MHSRELRVRVSSTPPLLFPSLRARADICLAFHLPSFYWYFNLDGTIAFDVKLTGILTTGALQPGDTPRFGTELTPQLYGAHHQHVFSVRLDMAVDGDRNSVYEVDTEALSLDDASNKYGNAFVARRTLLETERQAQRLCEPSKARTWHVLSKSRTNRSGHRTGYKLVPGENALPLAHPSSSVMTRGGYMSRHLWVTQFDASERFPAGEYPNQDAGGTDGLPQWADKRNASLRDTDLVLWYTMAHTHVVRCEDWPVMPVVNIGFSLMPVNFFDQNPANDVPPSKTIGGSAASAGACPAHAKL